MLEFDRAYLFGFGADSVPDGVQLATNNVIKALEQTVFQGQLAGVDLVGFAQLLDAGVHEIRYGIIYCAHGWAEVQPHLHQLYQQNNQLHQKNPWHAMSKSACSSQFCSQMQHLQICSNCAYSAMQDSLRHTSTSGASHLAFVFFQGVFDSTLIPRPQKELSDIQSLHCFLNLHAC